MKTIKRCGVALGILFALLLISAPVSAADDPHLKAFQDNLYPSAAVCGQCHPRAFAEWSSSNHAYASISPMFHKFEQSINDLTTGTIGSFCVRCHQQVGTQNGEKREAPLWERSAISREGVTCITCHRVKAEFGKVNGERHIEAGDINQPIFSTLRGTNLPSVLANPDDFGLKSDKNPNGTAIHKGVIQFEQLGKSEFCVSCHQVAVNIGIKLEIVWDQYRASPALKQGIQCQDCHMGKTPGKADGFETASIAIVNGHPVGDDMSRHSNHAFFGPGYPIAHPGIFPYNPNAMKWPIQDWLQFDYQSDWGKPAFEEAGHAASEFPAPWRERKDREFARIIVNQNLKALEYKRRLRQQVMENGSRVDGPFFADPPKAGHDLSLRYRLTNTDIGHNLPSGSLGAQPEIWFNVALIDPDGKNVWESGYVDSNGDMADLHSRDVRDGLLDHDGQLVNLQAKFLTTNVKGTDREMPLPVNFDGDQLPFLRPAGQPTTVMNHPPFVRMENRSLPPLGWRDAKYDIPAAALKKPGVYKLLARLRSRAEPMYFMRFVGATHDMEKEINSWMIDIHPYAVQFEVH